MNNISKTSLFSELSPEAASQTQGGHWGSYYGCSTSVTTVRVRYYPTGGYSSTTNNINIVDSDIDDGSIVNIGSAY